MNDQNFYTMYAQSSVLEASPLRLVIALYEGAIGAVEQAKGALTSGDILGRSRHITKAVSVLAELMCSLDHEKGGEISANLKRLYSYMQQRLLAAHATKSAEPMDEVVKLLSNLLESWQQLAEEKSNYAYGTNVPSETAMTYAPEQEMGFSYNSYFAELGESRRGEVFSF